MLALTSQIRNGLCIAKDQKSSKCTLKYVGQVVVNSFAKVAEMVPKREEDSIVPNFGLCALVLIHVDPLSAYGTSQGFVFGAKGKLLFCDLYVVC